MAIIKQISVYDGNSWTLDDIGVNAENVSLSANSSVTLNSILPADKLTTSKALMTNGNGVITTSSVSSTLLGYLSGASSNIQTQINTMNTTLGNKITKDSFTAKTGKPTANLTPAFGETATISQVTQATSGQISVTDRTIKIPNTAASTSAAGLMSAADKTKLNGLISSVGNWTPFNKTIAPNTDTNMGTFTLPVGTFLIIVRGYLASGTTNPDGRYAFWLSTTNGYSVYDGMEFSGSQAIGPVVAFISNVVTNTASKTLYCMFNHTATGNQNCIISVKYIKLKA